MTHPTSAKSDIVEAGRLRVIGTADAVVFIVCLLFLVKAIWLGAALRIALLFFAVFASGMAWLYIRKKMLVTGRYLMFSALWLAIVCASLTTGRDISIAMSWFPISIFLAVLLGDLRFCVQWTILTSATVVFFMFAQNFVPQYDLFWVDEDVGLHLRMHLVAQMAVVAVAGIAWLRANDELTKKLVQREESLEQMRIAVHSAEAHAAEAENVKRSFLASISHEVRTPLNSIVGFSKRMVHQGNALSSRDAEAALCIYRNGKSILYLFNDLLELADNDATTLTYSARPFPLDALVLDCVAKIEPVARQYGIAIQYVAAQAVAVTGDQARLAQAISSLLYFSLNETKEGTISVHLGKATRDRIPGGTITICDTSDGIYAEQLKILFDSHYHFVLNSNKDLPLSPLSLVLCATLIRLHGGTISVTSDLGKGSVFRVWLPCEEEEPELPPSPE